MRLRVTQQIMAKVLAWLTGLFFVLYGGAFTLFPLEMATMITGDHPSNSTGLIDLRATYGGMSVAVGVAIILVVRAEMMSLALLLTGVVLLAMACGRVLGMVIDGEPNALMYIYLAAEVVFGCAALLLQINTTNTENA